MTARLASRMRGISLIEALVALAVVGIGMIGMVGVQATLRSNADVAKQRSTAVRLLQTGTEEWRAFAILEADASVDFVDYTDLDPLAPEIDTTTVDNADYERTREVVELAAPLRGKLLAATVDWTDRAGGTQTVQLATVIAGIAPELAASLAIPPDGDPVRLPQGRHRGIPVWAQDLGDGRSAFKPPQGAGGTVVWVFHNVTGVLQTCAILDLLQPLSAANIGGCVGRAQLLSGYVNFADDAAQATADEALVPTGTAFAVEVNVMRTLPAPLNVATGSGCFTAAPVAGVPNVAYFCAVPVSADLNDPPIWSGYSIVTSASLPVAPVVGEKSTCRYTTERSDNAIANLKHPRAYSAVAEPLAGQNFLVVRVVANNASDCPDGAPLPAGNTTFPQPQTPP